MRVETGTRCQRCRARLTIIVHLCWSPGSSVADGRLSEHRTVGY